MSKLFLLLLLTVACELSAVSQSGRRITTPRPAPPQPSINAEPEPQPAIAPVTLFSLPESLRERPIKSVDGSSFRFADFEGKVIVINLWASWCGPCRSEIPDYERVRKTYADRDIEFVGLTTEDPRTSSERVRGFLRDVAFGFRLGWADRDTARTLMNGRSGIPQTIVIDANGRIVDHWTGYSPRRSRDKLTEAIDHALKIEQ
jgi:thiol-disulfide isomerase/thioredoxin